MLLLLLSLPKLLLVATCCCLPPTIVGAEAAGPPPMSVSVYALLPAPSAATVARKQKYDLERSLAAAEDATTTTPRNVTVQYWTLDQQRAFLERSSQQCAVNNVTAVAVFDALDYGSAFHSEVFKWCALLTSDYDKTLWLDSHSPIIDPALLHRILQTHDNVAVEHKETNSRSSIHGSYLQMRNTPANKQLAKQMLELILQTETNLLTTRARLVPDTLHGFIQQSDQRWHLLHLKCRKGTAKQQHANRNHLACPTGYCCSIQDDTNAAGGTVMISRHYLVPHQNIPSKASDDQERLFMATITVQEIHPPQNQTRTPNLYDILANEHCLPTGDCFHCLRNTEGATCESCAARCPCFCAKLCHTPVPTKNVVQQWTVVAPQYVKDPSRRIPRIVHQTWWEAIQPDVYPNLSRLVESFRQSGWEYRFYTDRDAVAFLQKHFPPSVFEAYQALVPGAFKADLFRYCVLLIAGGLYADVDIHLESALDRAIPPDVGFMVPLDEVRF